MDGSADAHFLLLGRVAESIVEKPVGSLLAAKCHGSEFPLDVRAIIGMKYTWNARIAKDDFWNGLKALQVVSVNVKPAW